MTTEPTASNPPPVIREPAPEEENAEPLPAYDLEEAQQRILANTTEATEDGRIEVNLDSKIASVFARLVDIPELPEYIEEPPVYEEAPPWTLCLNIVIQVVGSRGDVQPFVAMGNELQKYGHRVRIATHSVFKGFVQSAGLEFYPIGGDPAQLMAYMVKNPGLIPNMKTLRGGEIGAKRRMISEMMLGCWKSCVEPDPDIDAPFVANAIIANPVSFAHVHCAQALSIPLHMVFTMPWSPTRAFPHPLANVKNTTTDPKLANYLSFGLVNALTWQGLGDIINKFRKEVLGLEMVPATEGPFLSETLRIPHTYCWSPALVPKPKDWPDHLDVTGFIFRAPPEYCPPEDLAAFLRAGPPPLYVGFGSIVVERPDVLLRTILDAVQLSGVRCIIGKGWSSLAAEEVPENVYMVDECPHEWLFQHTFAVVHHGGAGTTAAGLRAGKPTVIIPFFGDQPFWGDMVAAAGAGPTPIPHQRLDAGNLAEAIDFCKTAETIEAAKAVGAKMDHEVGAQAAVKSFHRHLQPEVLRCDLIPTYPALFQCTKSKRSDVLKVKYDSKTLKLSGLAAEILTRTDKVRPKDLEVYHPRPIIIENRRWDPVTSASSAGIGVAVDLITTTNDFWYAPYKLHSRRHKATSSASSFVSTKSDSRDDGHEMAESSNNSSGRRAISTARYAGASASTIPKLFGVFIKGVAVTIPDALTEGLRATPKLYGEKVKDHAPVTNWTSGFKVAGKDLVVGVGTGLADIIVQPYKGARDDGAKGFAAGVGKGFLGTFTKVGYGTAGLYSHSAKGIWKSIHAARNATTRKDILSAKRIHDIYFARNEGSKVDEQAVVAAFEEV